MVTISYMLVAALELALCLQLGNEGEMLALFLFGLLLAGDLASLYLDGTVVGRSLRQEVRYYQVPDQALDIGGNFLRAGMCYLALVGIISIGMALAAIGTIILGEVAILLLVLWKNS